MRQHRNRSIAVAILSIGALVTPFVVFAQQQAGAPAGASAARMEVTTGSETARSEFRQAVFNLHQINYAAVREHAKKALASDPNLGVAMVILARPVVSPQITAAERDAWMTRGMAEAAKASAPEILYALYTRETVAGRTQAAQQTLRALAALTSDDPDIQFQLHVVQRNAAATPADALRIDKEFLTRFPDYGPALNLNAYTRFATGDRAGAYDAVAQYARVNPEQPNAHDTWADILIMDGKLAEAMTHAQASMDLDSAWAPAAQLKMGAIKLLTGTPDEARRLFAKARDIANAAAIRIDARYWTATSHVMAHDATAAMREFEAIDTEVAGANLPAAAAATVQQRIAVLEALLGNTPNATARLAKSADLVGASAGGHVAHAALVYAALGDAAAAQANADIFAKAFPANSFRHTLNALAAVTARNFTDAEAALRQGAPNDLLVQELRAEIQKQHGNTAVALTTREEVLKRVPKADGAQGVDVVKLVARFRAGTI